MTKERKHGLNPLHDNRDDKLMHHMFSLKSGIKCSIRL